MQYITINANVITILVKFLLLSAPRFVKIELELPADDLEPFRVNLPFENDLYQHAQVYFDKFTSQVRI